MARLPGAEPRLAAEALLSATHPFELAAVELTTTTGRWTGWIATDGARTSDWLNHSSELTIRGLTAVGPTDDLSEASLPTTDGLTELRLPPEEVVFVVPPPLPPNRHLRLHRRKVRIHLEVGAYRVSGQLHVRPGANADDYVFRSSRRMVPLTEVELGHLERPASRRLLPVLIVNARHVTRMRQAEQRGRPLVTSTAARLSGAPGGPGAPAPAPAPGAGGAGSHDALVALRLLLDAGLLSVAEFQAKREELLARPPS